MWPWRQEERIPYLVFPFCFYGFCLWYVLGVQPSYHLDVLVPLQQIPTFYKEILVNLSPFPWLVTVWKGSLALSAVSGAWIFRLVSFVLSLAFLPYLQLYQSSYPDFILPPVMFVLMFLPKKFEAGRKLWQLEVIRYQFFMIFAAAILNKLIVSKGAWVSSFPLQYWARVESIDAVMHGQDLALFADLVLPPKVSTLLLFGVILGQLTCLFAAFWGKARPLALVFVGGFFSFQYLAWGWIFRPAFAIFIGLFVLPAVFKSGLLLYRLLRDRKPASFLKRPSDL